MSRRAIFLDRDGVINKSVVRDGKPYPPADVSELVIIEGVPEALTSLREAGFLLIVVTNQPDVARGTVSKETVEKINATLAKELPIDEFRICYHDSSDECACRKPKPGMLIDAALVHGLKLGDCFMVGDRWRDVEAGQQAGCKTYFIDYGYDEKQPVSYDYRVSSLCEAARLILAEA